MMDAGVVVIVDVVGVVMVLLVAVVDVVGDPLSSGVPVAENNNDRGDGINGNEFTKPIALLCMLIRNTRSTTTHIKLIAVVIFIFIILWIFFLVL